MIPLYRLAKNMKFLPCPFVLLFSLLYSFILPIPTTYATAQAIPSVLSSNWSGLEATGPIGTFRKSQCTATIPKITTRGDVSVWCGLGGDPTALKGGQQPVLVQAGVDACLNANCIGSNCRRGVQCNSIWWEIADALVVQPVRFTKGVHDGDVVYTYMQSNVQNDNTDVFYLLNRTTGESHTIRVTAQGATRDGSSTRIVGPRSQNIPIATDAASVECIVERPLDVASNSFIKLAAFQSTTVLGCDDGRDSQNILEPITNNSTVTTITMFDKAKGGSSLDASNVKVLAAPQQPFSRTTGQGAQVIDSFNVVQPTTTQATRRGTRGLSQPQIRTINPLSSRH